MIFFGITHVIPIARGHYILSEIAMSHTDGTNDVTGNRKNHIHKAMIQECDWMIEAILFI